MNANKPVMLIGECGSLGTPPDISKMKPFPIIDSIDPTIESLRGVQSKLRNATYSFNGSLQIVDTKAWNRLFPPNRPPRGMRPYT